MLLAVNATALHLLSGAFLAVSASWPLYPAAAAASDRTTNIQADVPSPEAWRMCNWRRTTSSSCSQPTSPRASSRRCPAQCASAARRRHSRYVS
ncbi:hypothetical protein SEVIR_7G022652v4 [Setaria viridis]